MIPERIRAQTRQNIPLWAVAAGVIVLILIIFFAWIGLSMSHAPTPEPTTQDVPLSR